MSQIVEFLFWLILCIAASPAVVYLGRRIWYMGIIGFLYPRSLTSHRSKLEAHAISERADKQNDSYLAGKQEGFYGQWPPHPELNGAITAVYEATVTAEVYKSVTNKRLECGCPSRQSCIHKALILPPGVELTLIPDPPNQLESYMALADAQQQQIDRLKKEVEILGKENADLSAQVMILNKACDWAAGDSGWSKCEPCDHGPESFTPESDPNWVRIGSQWVSRNGGVRQDTWQHNVPMSYKDHRR